ncbi:MAG: hypothetical protein FWG93_07090, partial [Oscillospiraceae bacterium]|nr:hypothetical protein [Oscillospiraceae bacterium]
LPATAEMLIYTEGGPQDGEVAMPNVVSMTPERANQTLREAGLFMRATGALPYAGDVVRAALQREEPGSLIPFGSVVEVEFRNDSVEDAGAVDRLR